METVNDVADNFDVIVLGAGASGLMCSLTLAKRGKKVLILEKNREIAKKILVSGGGRCNFTNLNCSYQRFQSENPKFSISALKGFGAEDMIGFLKENRIAYFEKKAGQLFCEKSAKELVDAFSRKCHELGVQIIKGAEVESVQLDGNYRVNIKGKYFSAPNLVVATGGLSFPGLGVSDVGYRIAKKFGHQIVPFSPGLVPLKVKGMSSLAGVSLPVDITLLKGKKKISEDLLFTHKGISGPAVLTASLYWEKGKTFTINFLPKKDIKEILLLEKEKNSQKIVFNILKNYLPANFLKKWIQDQKILDKKISEIPNKSIFQIGECINRYQMSPNGDLGFEKAEVTKGGVSTKDLSSKTMESKLSSGLYFIGEVVDITGELGGFNFCWAWASGYAAGSSF